VIPQNKRVILFQEKKLNDTIKVGDADFILDNVFRSLWNTIQKAVVYETAEGTDLKAGDGVIVHHFISEKESQLPFKNKKLCWLEYNQIYARIRNGEMKMLNNFLFVKPIKFDNTRFFNNDSGFIMTGKSKDEFVERMGIAHSLSDSCKEAGLKEGDVILFGKNCEYQIDVDGEKLYRMELRDVITTVDDDIQITAIKA